MAAPNQPTHYACASGCSGHEKSASEKLDISGVQSACDAVVTAAEEGCKTICDNMKNVQIGKETLCVADSSLESTVEEVENYINSISSDAIKPTMDQVYDEAVSAYNKLQEQCDEEAEAERDSHKAQLEAAAKQSEES